jgi:hypothetical protein
MEREHTADVSLFLASDESSAINGAPNLGGRRDARASEHQVGINSSDIP